MPVYTAPLDDMTYLLENILDADAVLASLPGGAETPVALLKDVLAEAGRYAAEIAQPLNRSGDEEGCRLENGQVFTPSGFPDAYKAFVEGGWPGLAHEPELGGQGLPRIAQLFFDEMLSGANFSFGLYPGLTRGAIEAIARHADDALKAAYLPKMVEGRWMGAMALTESHAGTDLGLLRAKAEPLGDGRYRVTGSKIFISAGDHDLAENIIHLVLARLPDAPPGVKGISLFLVPKHLPGSTGRNFWVGALEHKMGIKGSATCVMNYDGSIGWLVGEAHKGLAAMFTMMNAERLFVGIQGLGIAEVAYQNALAYARERLQGRGAGSRGPDPILVHPDIRKMLLSIRAFTQAGRALAGWVALEMEKAARHPELAVRAQSEGLVSLLTPVIKAAFTDLGFEATVAAQQVFGGHGYVREWGMEQFVRDARIAQIYEGTNGVQAMDLVTRKLAMEEGALPGRFFALIEAALDDVSALPGAGPFATPLAQALLRLRDATTRLQAAQDAAEAGAAATDYLRLFALVSLGWMWLRMAADNLRRGETQKLDTARFFFSRILPQTIALEAAIQAGASSITEASF
ncbi:acyl-CoA dehydrogenase C-terminal domain-containing protein [Acetobacteraceae bacterium H6797]|nr:acyl-CoA dehydrogenase C-terminal domain-containing protein [Acetobacteraceae bacterium H6797]